MSIIDKHPAPWTMHDEHLGSNMRSSSDPIMDASGTVVADNLQTSDGVKRLILAAPELLAALKDAVAAINFATHDDCFGRTMVRCDRGEREEIPDPRATCLALIARIEEHPQCPAVSRGHRCELNAGHDGPHEVTEFRIWSEDEGGNG